MSLRCFTGAGGLLEPFHVASGGSDGRLGGWGATIVPSSSKWDGHLGISTKFGYQTWWLMVIIDEYWWLLKIIEEYWWILVISGDEWWWMVIYPLVNSHITMENHRIFDGQINDFKKAMFNSKLLVYQRVSGVILPLIFRSIQWWYPYMIY